MYFSDTFAAGGSLGGLPWGPGATKSHYSEFGGVRLETHPFFTAFLSIANTTLGPKFLYKKGPKRLYHEKDGRTKKNVSCTRELTFGGLAFLKTHTHTHTRKDLEKRTSF